MFYEDRVSSRGYVEDEVSSSSPLIFCGVPGKARRCFNVVVPSAWDDGESMKWCYDERYFERELYFDRKIELFEVSRSYKELRERLKRERADDYIEYLPCDGISAANDVKVDENIIYLTVTNHTKSDLTILDGDKLYDVIIWNNPCLLYTSRCV